MPGRQPPFSALITAEHASRRVPPRWRPLFAREPDVLNSHRAWDPGTAVLARELAAALHAPVLAGRVTRLLVDLNRSARHPGLHSAFTRPLPATELAELRGRYWQPHWDAYREWLRRLPGTIVHIACHSFTPVWDGRPRRVDIGLLYDPRREREQAWCAGLREGLRARLPGLRIVMNQPYRGTSNGLGQQHRKPLGPHRLIAMELEISQRLVARPDWPATRRALVGACREALGRPDRAGSRDA